VSTQLQSLELWRGSLVASVRSDAPDLSARQMALMLCVYLDDGPHTVRGLAKYLKISKPAISRALDRLGELSYIRRERDDLDRRNVLVQRTPEGAAFLLNFSTMIADAEKAIAGIADEQALGFALEAVSAAVAAIEAGSSTDASAPSQPNWSTVAA